MNSDWLDKILNTASTIVPAVFSPNTKATPAPVATAPAATTNWTPFLIGGVILAAVIGFLALRRK